MKSVKLAIILLMASLLLSSCGSFLKKSASKVTNLISSTPDGTEEKVEPPVAASGLILYSHSNGHDFDVYSMKPDGSDVKRLTSNDIEEEDARLSPDGSKIVFHGYSLIFHNIYIIDVDGNNMRYLTSGYSAAFSPDGKKLAVSDRDSSYNDIIYIFDLATGKKIPLYELEVGFAKRIDWSPDGKKLVFEYVYDLFGGNQQCIMMINTEGSPNPVELTHKNEDNNQWAFAYQPRFSADGERILYSFNDKTKDDTLHIYTMKTDGSNIIQITKDNIRTGNPVWSPDGKYIIYRNDTGPAAEIFIMNSKGKSKTQLTKNDGYDYPSDWK